MQDDELSGGLFTGRVTRLGDAVLRPVHEATHAIHSFLAHLESIGFTGSPRVLGLAEDGREMLSFIEGEVPKPPMPEWVRSDKALVSVARLIRELHDASSSFAPPENAVWKRGTSPSSGPFVCHNDLVRTNVVFRDGSAVALLDFDAAHPSDPLWEVAMAAWHWVPLLDPIDRTEAEREADAPGRLRCFCDAYGMEASERLRVPELAELFNRRKHASLRPLAREKWARDMSGRSWRSAEWFRSQQEILRAALQ